MSDREEDTFEEWCDNVRGCYPLVRYENLDIYEALSRARACCRWVWPNSVMALSAGVASSITFCIWAA